MLPYAMRVLHVSPGVWAREIGIPALIPVAPLAVTFYVLDRLVSPVGLLALGLVIGAGGVAYCVAYLCLAATPAGRDMNLQGLLGRAVPFQWP